MSLQNKINDLASSLVAESKAVAKAKKTNVDHELSAATGDTVAILCAAIEQARRATRIL